MGLDALVESYGFWRPSLRSLMFEDIPGMKQGVPGSHGVPSHLLSSSPCSSPFKVCPHSPLDDTCSRPTHPLHHYVNPASPFPLPVVRRPSAFCSMSPPPSQFGYLHPLPRQGYGSICLHSPHYGLYGYSNPH
uniref:T-box transcription factor TBX18-like n=1 Tax=Oncorhynchus gorbuscha TaxID=8017 RepID=UPI001EAEAFD3|nr:T-box transcription factor TBX18-like [Oncorhynchus gorbuscha]